MNNHRDNAIQAAKNCLKEYLNDEMPSWIGPYYIAVADHLEISIPPMVYHVPEAELIYGEAISIPSVSLEPLLDWAFRHPEVFHLFKTVAADLVLRPQELPKEVRLFLWTILTDKVAAPKAPSQSASEIPSTKRFLRDFAICQTLALLQNQFNLPPTHNMANEGETGATIVCEALGNLGYKIGISSINSIWSKRQDIDKIKTFAIQKIRKLPSSLTP